ncbi:hypothetical protein [Ensifer canadensis]
MMQRSKFRNRIAYFRNRFVNDYFLLNLVQSCETLRSRTCRLMLTGQNPSAGTQAAAKHTPTAPLKLRLSVRCATGLARRAQHHLPA